VKEGNNRSELSVANRAASRLKCNGEGTDDGSIDDDDDDDDNDDD
jgi:hypothetical protein